MTARWMYLLFPQLYLQQVISHQPDPEPLARQPVALILQHQQRHIWQCNRAAQAAGVEQDMPLNTAMSLCPALRLLPMDMQQQQQILHARAHWAGQFSAFVSPDPPHGLWLEIASMLRLFQGPDALLHQIQQAAADEGWPLQPGIGQTPLMARIRAHLNQPFVSDNRDLPLLTLAQLQQGLPLTPPQVYQLQRLGIQRLQDIQRLPLSGLASRLGVPFSQTIRRLLGMESHPLEAFHSEEMFQQQVNFIHEVEYSNGLLFPLQRLLKRLSEFLQRRQLSTRLLELQLSHRQQPDTDWQIRFAHSEHQHSQLVFMLRHFLENRRLSAPVQSLVLRVTQFTRRSRGQTNLLAPASGSYAGEDSTQETGQLLNRLSARLQPQQLLRLHTEPDPRPEQASRLRKLVAWSSLP